MCKIVIELFLNDDFVLNIHVWEWDLYSWCSMHKSEPNTLNHFKDNFGLKFSSKFYMIIDAY